MTTVIIDTDPGIDDVVTLALTARSPELEIAAVTTTYGNAALADTTRNARHVLRLAGRTDIPVLPGVDRPLRRPLVTAPETHGEGGVGYASVPADRRTRGPADRVLANSTVLLDALRLARKSVTLVTLGPLTNLAHALRSDGPSVRRSVDRHIGMFGSLYERGNVNRWADFNAWCDPEAVVEVLDAGLDTHMVGLDVTRRMVVRGDAVSRLARSSDPLVAWLAGALRFYVEFHRRREVLDGCVVNDVLTVGELLAPGLLAFSRRALKISTGSDEHRGRTVEGTSGTPVRVALSVDLAVMHRLLDRVFGPAWDERVVEE